MAAIMKQSKQTSSELIVRQWYEQQLAVAFQRIIYSAITATWYSIDRQRNENQIDTEISQEKREICFEKNVVVVQCIVLLFNIIN